MKPWNTSVSFCGLFSSNASLLMLVVFRSHGFAIVVKSLSLLYLVQRGGRAICTTLYKILRLLGFIKWFLWFSVISWDFMWFPEIFCDVLRFSTISCDFCTSIVLFCIKNYEIFPDCYAPQLAQFQNTSKPISWQGASCISVACLFSKAKRVGQILEQKHSTFYTRLPDLKARN